MWLWMYAQLHVAVTCCLCLPGYIIQDARMFTLLTTAPVTEISSYAAPEDSSSLRSALFTLSTADNRDVTWECQLANTGTWDGGLVSGLTTVPTAGSVGTSTGWQACSDPQVCTRLAARHSVKLVTRHSVAFATRHSVWLGRRLHSVVTSASQQ